MLWGRSSPRRAARAPSSANSTWWHTRGRKSSDPTVVWTRWKYRKGDSRVQGRGLTFYKVCRRLQGSVVRGCISGATVELHFRLYSNFSPTVLLWCVSVARKLLNRRCHVLQPAPWGLGRAGWWGTGHGDESGYPLSVTSLFPWACLPSHLLRVTQAAVYEEEEGPGSKDTNPQRTIFLALKSIKKGSKCWLWEGGPLQHLTFPSISRCKFKWELALPVLLTLSPPFKNFRPSSMVSNIDGLFLTHW